MFLKVSFTNGSFEIFEYDKGLYFQWKNYNAIEKGLMANYQRGREHYSTGIFKMEYVRLIEVVHKKSEFCENE